MRSSSKPYGTLLVTYLRPQRLRVLGLAVLLLSSIGVQLLNPQILRAFIDNARNGAALSTLTGIALVFLGVALASQVITVAETYLSENVGLTATNRLRSDLALHCLELDMSFHNARTPGELIERIDGDVAQLSNFFSRFTIQVLGNALLLVGVLVLLFQIDWRVGTILSLFAVIGLGVVNSLRNLAVPHWMAGRAASAELFGFLEERIAGTEDLRASGATTYALRRLQERSRELLHKQLKAALVGRATGTAAILLFTTGTALAFALGAWLFHAGTITLGTVYLIFSYTELLRQPIEQLTRQFQDLQQAVASLTRIQSLLAVQRTILDGAGGRLPAGALSVALDDVTFGYGVDEPVLRDLSFRLAPGRVLGLLGRTGSGKTTLIRLLFRLYEPQSGAIQVGDVNVRDASIHVLRQRVGMVTQDIQLFNASVRDNLTLFDPSIADDRIVTVLDELGLGFWYRSLPTGLDTKLAPGGSGLSAGEAQLLAFTRVFLRDPGLVILDEASSRLDPATERLVDQAVARLLAGRTGIIIAHRLQTVDRVDEIMILERGQVGEHGPRAALAADPGSRFATMLRTGLEEVLV